LDSQKDNALPSSPSPRTASIIGGIGLLIMAVLAAYANFAIMQPLIIPGEVKSTIENIIASSGSFRLATISFLVVAVLDIVVALALCIILKSANKHLALIAAWFRIIYAVIFAFSLTNLFGVFQLLTSPESPQNNEIFTQAMNRINAFQKGWDIGLILFGLHLLLLGFIAFRFGTIPKWLGALLAIAGLGYLVDSIGILLSPQYNLSLGEYTFFGELILIFWLLWRGIKGFPQQRETLN
jgi:hypothetical protein